jgi:hypothetical protein
MDSKRTLPVNKRAWFVFSLLFFSMAWLLWAPWPKETIQWWQVWQKLSAPDEGDREAAVLFLTLGSGVFFLVAAFLGWISQFVWGLLISGLRRGQ